MDAARPAGEGDLLRKLLLGADAHCFSPVFLLRLLRRFCVFCALAPVPGDKMRGPIGDK
jgi:hypothetical protein